MKKNYSLRPYEEHEINMEYAKAGEQVAKRLYDDFFHFSAASTFFETDDKETDFSTLTASEIIEKIRDFLKQNRKDINLLIFFNYLAAYPVTMCKREVSPFLKRLIGFHYRFGVPDKEQEMNGATKVSYDDLAEIFVRSKATISECVNETEIAWRETQERIEESKRIEAEAKKQLIEEEKKRLREEEMKKQSNNQPNERTSQITTVEG